LERERDADQKSDSSSQEVWVETYGRKSQPVSIFQEREADLEF